MSYRALLFAARGIKTSEKSKFRKFQKSKLPPVVKTKSKTKLILVEVPNVEESETDK